MLSFRDVEELLAARFIVVTYETVRQSCLKFGQHFANGIRRRRGRLGDTWHLDEVFVIDTASKATASKPLTVSRVFAVHKSETGSHDARSVLSAYRIRNDLRKRGCRYCGFNDAESGSGLLSHADARHA
jgi:hypothetical protein